MLDNRIEDLKAAVATLPAEHFKTLAPFVQRLEQANDKRKRTLKCLQECIGKLRLDFLYLKFDNDCLRSERDEAREEAGQ